MLKIKSSNTILYCNQWKKTVFFYHSLLNLPVITSLDWFVEFKISETSRLSIADASKTTIKSSKGNGVTIVFEVDDIHIAHSNLIQLGFKDLVIKNHPWEAQVINLYDPEGSRVEFWSSN
jgi:predicted enzyme related to lactoylglutathione lyase